MTKEGEYDQIFDTNNTKQAKEGIVVIIALLSECNERTSHAGASTSYLSVRIQSKKA